MRKKAITIDLNKSLLEFVLDTLSLEPKSAFMNTINLKNDLTVLDLFLKFFDSAEYNDDFITEINIETLA